MADDEEAPLAVYRLSKIIFAGPLIVGSLGAAALVLLWSSGLGVVDWIGVTAFGAARYEAAFPVIFLALRIVTAVIAMILSLQLFVCVIRYLTTELRIFKTRVLWRTGFVSRNVFTMAMREIIGVNFDQSVVGRMFGYGTVMISTRGDDRIKARLISAAPEASRMVMNLKDGETPEARS